MMNKATLIFLGMIGLGLAQAQETAVTPVTTDSVIQVPSLSHEQREQIKADLDERRSALEAQYKQNKRACYQFFDVSGCQLKARDAYLQAHVALRKEELRYLDREREFKNQEVAEGLAQRVSEDSQKKAQEQRDQSVREAQQRQAENARKQLDFASKGSKRAEYEQKQKEAQAHRQSVQDQINERDKPAAPTLPVPPEVQR